MGDHLLYVGDCGFGSREAELEPELQFNDRKNNRNVGSSILGILVTRHVS